MALNIKNDDTYRLAQELASETGESLTEAVTVALRERLSVIRSAGDPETLQAEVAAIQEFVAALPDRDTRSADEILDYDEHGLPR